MPLLVEAGWGGVVTAPASITWTDITRYTDTVRGVAISRGASDELSETQPGTATLRLDNADGRFTPGNSSSPYYPNVRRNTPLRVSVAVMPTLSGSAPYPMAMLGDTFDDDRIDPTLWPTNSGATETGGRLRIPLTPGVDIAFASARQWKLTGSKLTAKLATTPKAGGSSNAAASMWVTSTTSGTRIGWRYDALTGVLAAMSQSGFSDATPTNLTYSPIDHAWLRVRESSGTVYWETSGDGVDWTVRRTLPTPAWVGAQTHAVEFPTTRTGGTGDYIEWDLVGAQIKPRFYGMFNEFPVDWEGLASTVTVTASDLFKRLNRLPALRSMLSEEIAETGPLYYFPLNETSDSTTAGDMSGTGLPSLAIAQAGSGGTLTLGSTDGPPETGDQAPVFTPVSATAGKWLTADMGPVVADPMRLYLCMEAWFQTTTTGRCIMGIHSTDLTYQHLLSLNASGSLQIEWTWDGTPLTIEPVSGATGLNNGAWHHVVYDQYNVAIWVDGVLVDSSLAVPRTWEERVLHVGGYRGTRLWNGSVAHVAMYSTTSSYGATAASHYSAGMTGYAGETADVRIQRLARYAGLSSVTVFGTTHDTIASQGPGGTQVVARMREVEATESGKLYAERDFFGLAYQSRDVRYNPSASGETFTLSYADLDPGTSLADDDQKLCNSVTAARPGGATQRVASAASITQFGRYEQSLDILKTNDNSVLDAANWLVSRYADPAPEVREIVVEAYTLANYLDILDADISSYFTIFGMPSQAPASFVRLNVEGYDETLTDFGHRIQFHTSAAITDSVWVLDDPTYAVLDSTTRLAY